MMSLPPRLSALLAHVCLIFALALLAMAPARMAAANDKYASMVVDHETGTVLRARSADKRLYPASMTKLMTLYLVFEAIEQGKLKMNDYVHVSQHAADQPPSKIGYEPGKSYRLREIVQASAVKSANDAAVIMAEAVGGSESRFARMMTAKARALGMRSTTFYNASGLPDSRQKTTARDMITLGRALYKRFPEHMHLFSARSYTFNGHTYRNTNRLLGKYPGMDGLKTGYIRASGFNLIATAQQDGRRLFAVVFGGKTGSSRNDHMVKILDEGFASAKAKLGNASSPIVLAPPPPRKPGEKPGEAEPTLAEVAPTPPPAIDDNRIAAAQQVIRNSVAVNEPPQHMRIIRPSPRNRFYSGGDDDQPRTEIAAIDQANTGYADRESSDEAIWAVQIGVWRNVRDGRHGLDRVRAMLPDKLNHAEGVVVRRGSGRRTLYHARFLGYEQAQAEALCDAIKRRGNGCLPIIHRD